MQVPKLEDNQQTLQHLQQERLLYFDVFRHHMSSYCIKPYMDGFYTSIAFQRYQEHPNRSSDDKVMVLRSWSKNRKAVATSRRCRELQKRSIPTSRRCQTTSRRKGSILGGFLAHFEPIMEVFKAQTVEIEREGDW